MSRTSRARSTIATSSGRARSIARSSSIGTPRASATSRYVLSSSGGSSQPQRLEEVEGQATLIDRGDDRLDRELGDLPRVEKCGDVHVPLAESVLLR